MRKCFNADMILLQYFFIIISTRCTNFANFIFGMKLYIFGECFCPSSGVHS